MFSLQLLKNYFLFILLIALKSVNIKTRKNQRKIQENEF